jgi:hypothetical protein
MFTPATEEPMTIQHRIKRGVSLYSYQYETFLRTMTLDDCIAHAAGIGARFIRDHIMRVTDKSFDDFAGGAWVPLPAH